MIIVKLMGGLGNQMFQYAAGKTLAIKNETDLILDLSFYNTQNKATKRNYNLNIFNITAKTYSDLETKKLINKYFNKSIIKKIQAFILKENNGLVYYEKVYSFNPAVLELANNVFLNGYFQSEKYFKEKSNVILKEFSLKNTISDLSKQLLNNIDLVDSISIHIRRADYVSNTEINKFHGVCSLDYYQNAIDYIRRYINKPHYFIYSDDIDWVKKNIIIEGPAVYVSDYRLRDYEELYLMSRCKHNIIANSSFSWWGAWLNQNQEKIIIAPNRWFADESINTIDLIPSSWIRL